MLAGFGWKGAVGSAPGRSGIRAAVGLDADWAAVRRTVSGTTGASVVRLSVARFSVDIDADSGSGWLSARAAAPKSAASLAARVSRSDPVPGPSSSSAAAGVLPPPLPPGVISSIREAGRKPARPSRPPWAGLRCTDGGADAGAAEEPGDGAAGRLGRGGAVRDPGGSVSAAGPAGRGAAAGSAKWDDPRWEGGVPPAPLDS